MLERKQDKLLMNMTTNFLFHFEGFKNKSLWYFELFLGIVGLA
jgi:hypothetical protein